MSDTMMVSDLAPAYGSGHWPTWHGAIYEIPSDTSRTIEAIKKAISETAPMWTCPHKHRGVPHARRCSQAELKRRS